jgi:hypothetical protein
MWRILVLWGYPEQSVGNCHVSVTSHSFEFIIEFIECLLLVTSNNYNTFTIVGGLNITSPHSKCSRSALSFPIFVAWKRLWHTRFSVLSGWWLTIDWLVLKRTEKEIAAGSRHQSRSWYQAPSRPMTLICSLHIFTCFEIWGPVIPLALRDERARVPCVLLTSRVTMALARSNEELPLQTTVLLRWANHSYGN